MNSPKCILGAMALLIAVNGGVAAAADEHVLDLIEGDEPGLPMVVSGRMFDADGTTPLRGVRVRVYQTDARGYYARDGRLSDPRLEGWLRTDEDGRYVIHTIRPAPYPNRAIPAHIHFVVRAAKSPQRFELQFEDDPLVSKRAIGRSRDQGRFGTVRPARRDESGVLHVEKDIRLRD